MRDAIEIRAGVAAAVAAAIVTGGFALFARVSGAQPVRHIALDEAVVTRTGECVRLDLKFNFQVVYLRHFPAWTGPSIYVQVRPIVARIPPVREGIVASGADAGPLERIAYDADPGATPLVVLDFSRPVAFDVSQGAAFDTISIRYDPAGTGGACLRSYGPDGNNNRGTAEK